MKESSIELIDKEVEAGKDLQGIDEQETAEHEVNILEAQKSEVGHYKLI